MGYRSWNEKEDHEGEKRYRGGRGGQWNTRGKRQKGELVRWLSRLKTLVHASLNSIPGSTCASVVPGYGAIGFNLIQTTTLMEHVPRGCTRQEEGRPEPASSSECLEGVPAASTLSVELWESCCLSQAHQAWGNKSKAVLGTPGFGCSFPRVLRETGMTLLPHKSVGGASVTLGFCLALATSYSIKAQKTGATHWVSL